MSITYKIQPNDTLDNISKKVFGSELHASHISRANPGLSNILIPGTSIVIPALPDYPGDIPKILGITGSNDVQIFIANTRFEFWTNLTIKRAIDNIDVITFEAPFEPDAPGFRELFLPFQYKTITVKVGNILLLSGVIISINPSVADSNIITVSGYSLPGVLHDCTMPANAFPLEFNGITLKEIAKAISKPFGLSVDFAVDPGTAFDKIAIEPTEKADTFLSKLARKKNLVIASTNDGKLKFWRSNDAKIPVAELEVGGSPVLSVTPQFNEQEYYSHITGISFVSTGVPGAQFTDKNPYLPGTVRPFTFGATDTDNVDIKTAVNAKTGRMFANMVSYSVEVSTWRDKQGDLWEPNTTIQLYAPRAYIFNKYKFILRSVEFRRDKNTETAILELILPGGFDGKIPEVLPWDL